MTAAAVAGLAGLAIGAPAMAAEDAPIATAAVAAVADDQGGRSVEGVDVRARRSRADVRVTAVPLDMPQTVTVVSRGVMEAQNLLSLRDVLSTVPGITFGAGEGGGGYGDSINLRGYSANNDITIDGVRDSAQYTRSDPFNLEQIEVINGANSVFGGAGSVGGTINLVSKRPMGRNSTTVSAGVGTDNYWRGAVDANLLVAKGVALRLNAVAHRQDFAGRDVEQAKRWGIAPALTFGLNGPTQFTAAYVHQEDHNTPQYGVPFYNGRPVPGVDPSSYFGYANLDKQEQTVDRLTGTIDHDFGGGLSLRNLSRWQKASQLAVVDPPQGVFCLANGQKPVAWTQTTTATNVTGYAACLPTDPAPGFYQPSGPRGNVRDSENTLLYNQTDLSWEVEAGGLVHTVVVGAAFLSETFRLDTGNILRAPNGTPLVLPQMNIANPVNTWTGSTHYIRSQIQDGERQNQAVYVFDNVEFGERWALNLGARWEHNEGENRTDAYATTGATLGQVTPGQTFRNAENLFSYRVGLVFKPAANASLYVSFANSKTPSQASVNGAGACNANSCDTPPERARNIEVGGKWDLDSRLSLTAALFRNERTNYRVPSGDPVVPDLQVIDGAARVDGLALGISGQVTEQWAVFANYTYLRSEVLQGVSDLRASQGLDFAKGDPLTFVPDHAFSLYTTYDLPSDIQLGYSVTYQGSVYLTQHGQITGSAPAARTTMPLITSEAYWVHRATVAWTGLRGVEVRLNVNNLLDEVYYTRVRSNIAGWATPGEGRSAQLTVNYRF